MPRRRKIRELTPADFPSVDKVAFAKWRKAAANDEPLAIAIYVALAILLPIIYVVFRPLRSLPVGERAGVLGIVVFVALSLPAVILTARPRRLAKEGGITPQAIKAARRKPRQAPEAGQERQAGQERKPLPAPPPRPVPRSAPAPERSVPTSTQVPAVTEAPIVPAETSGDPTRADSARARRVCPKCGWRNEAGARSCRSCRAQL